MACDGVVRQDSVSWALQLAGYISPCNKWIDELFEQVFGSKSSLDLEEFGQLVSHYDVRHRRLMRERFFQTGAVLVGPEDGLASLLREMGLVPFPWVLRELQQEVVGAGIVRGGREELSFLCTALRDCAGFTRTEAAELLAVFSRCDRTGIGKLGPSAVRAALRWLGAEANVPTAFETWCSDETTESEGASGQLPLSETEFLTLVRACQASEQRRIYSAFNAGNGDWFGMLSVGELPRIFEEASFAFVTPNLLGDFTKACGFVNRSELHFEDVCLLVARLRKTFGFGDAEASEIAAAFEVFDHDRSGSLDRGELTGAIRWLGYPVEVKGLAHILEELSLDHCRQVHVHEFPRVVAEYRDREVRQVREALEAHQGSLPPEELPFLLEGLGYPPTAAVAPATKSSPLAKAGDGGRAERGSFKVEPLGLWDLARHVAQHREEAQQRVRRSFGLTDEEVDCLRAAFKKCDPHRTGIVTGDDLVDILRDHLPWQRAGARARTEEVLREMGGGLWGRVGLTDLLRVRGLLRDFDGWDAFRKEKDALAKSSLTPKEVGEFREVFERFGTSAPNLLTFSEFRELLNGLLPSNGSLANWAAAELELRRTIEEAVGDVAIARGMDFPDFLCVMQALLDRDWQNISTIANLMAREFKTPRGRRCLCF